ncbi:MAG TPA: PP2C family serine/threonine-protein phosphatase [Azoarcus sp.]|nr:PP2C family serine/threonine-protein phosphatase [Azoarcus sp.]
MKFSIFQDSRPGRRRTNQDRIAYSYSRDALLMVLADGMGGHENGELAAEIATRSLLQSFQRAAHPTVSAPKDFLYKAMLDAHQAILSDALDRSLTEAPRTTVIACIVQAGSAWWAHAGDSRLYALRGRDIAARTRDHSRVQMLFDQGKIDAHGAQTHPERNRLYNCLGGNSTPHIDTSRRFALRQEDTIMLCSDGVWGPLGDARLRTGLSGAEVQESVPRIMARAEALGGPTCDNLSMIAMRWHGNDQDPAPETLSTASLSFEGFTTRMEGASMTPVPDTEFSNADIERAIDEINAAIKKLETSKN